jgi:hypothetical protein
MLFYSCFLFYLVVVIKGNDGGREKERGRIKEDDTEERVVFGDGGRM